MALNPAAILRIKNSVKAFERNHPKMARFITQEFLTDLPVGTVIEITVTKPGQAPVTGNCKVTPEDSALIEDLKSLR